MALRNVFGRVLKNLRVFPFSQWSEYSNMSSVQEISFDSLKDELQTKDVILVDVRELQELKDDGRIPGSVHIPIGKIQEAFTLSPSVFKARYGITMPDINDSNLVFSCKAGRRAASAAEKILPLGYKNVKVYFGSFLNWVERGGPIEKLN